MMKNNSYLLSAAIALMLMIVFLSTNVEKGECSSTSYSYSYIEKASCSSRNASACYAGDDEAEFVMDEFEMSRRILANKPKPISYDSINNNLPYCNANVYGSCIGPDGKYYKRGCDFKELCRPEWDLKMPSIVGGSILIMAKAGAGVAMFSIGLFMALQEKIIACGIHLTIYGLVLRFVGGPVTTCIGSLALGLRSNTLRIAIIQAALPQALTSFVFAKEINYKIINYLS